MAQCRVCGKYFDGGSSAGSGLSDFGFATATCPKCKNEERLRQKENEEIVRNDAYKFATLFHENGEKAKSELSIYIKRDKFYNDANVFYKELKSLSPDLLSYFSKEFSKRIEANKDSNYILSLSSNFISDLRQCSSKISLMLEEAENMRQEGESRDKALKKEKYLVLIAIILIELFIGYNFLFTSGFSGFVISAVIMILLGIGFFILNVSRYS